MNQPQVDPGRPPEKKGGGVLKGILIGCGVLVLLVVLAIGIGGYFIYRGISTDPAKVEAVAVEILTFDKPAAFHGKFSVSMMGFKMAALQAADGPDQNGAIILMSFPAGKANQEQMRHQMDAQLHKQGQKREVVERRENEKFKVRGQDVSAQVQVTKGKDDTRVLQYSLVMDGKPGETVLLMLTGSEKFLPHEAVQKFLDSVK